ncbi:MAG: hypothetical protein LAT68_12165 [Cyclobacteriaceae bacterium]|nr:hypothetical protein [Cyclobacteriaceae bacterium]
MEKLNIPTYLLDNKEGLNEVISEIRSSIFTISQKYPECISNKSHKELGDLIHSKVMLFELLKDKKLEQLMRSGKQALIDKNFNLASQSIDEVKKQANQLLQDIN